MLINGEKWACETCIKGHRASSCNHTNRQLLQIKKKGRPSTQCNRCKELRIVRQLHVKCNCSQTSNSDSSSSSGSGDSKSNDLSYNTAAPKKKRRTTKLRPLAPKEATSKSACGSGSKTQPMVTFRMPITTTTSNFTTSIVNNISVPAPTPVSASVSAPVSTSKSCCSSKTNSIIPPIITPTNTTSCCSGKAKTITPPIITPTTTSCCSGKTKTQTIASPMLTPIITNGSPHYHNNNNNYRMINHSQSSVSPIQNPTPPQEEEVEEDVNHHVLSRDISSIFTSTTTPFTYDTSSSDSLSPYIPPPTSCCGPPTKNKNGENIRIVTCRCGDSCACPGCDAHPSRAMKEGTKDVYYGFQAITDTPSSSSSSSSSSSKRIAISKICSSDEENDTNERHNIIYPQPKKSTASGKCGCGCDQLFENCFGCLNDLCQCSYGANIMEMDQDSEHESRYSL